MIEYKVDTDFPQGGDIYDCARRKCEQALRLQEVDYALASEGRFTFHPTIPFLACHQEVLHFIDRKRGFQLRVSHSSKKTNYQMQVVETLEELHAFSQRAKFPSHALLLRPNTGVDSPLCFEEISTLYGLVRAFNDSICTSNDGKVLVQTDMRASKNPSRMTVIEEAATKLAQRLATVCPACGAPGWGSTRTEECLPEGSLQETPQQLSSDLFGCALCEHTEVMPHRGEHITI